MSPGKQLFDLILTDQPDNEDLKLLQCLARYHKLEFQEWKQKNQPDTKKGIILYTKEINDSFLSRARLKNSIIIGNYKNIPDNLNGFPAIWNLHSENLLHLPFFTYSSPEKIKILALSGDRIFIHSLKFMTGAFSSAVVASSSEEKFLGYLQNSRHDLVIVDWDTPGLDINRFTAAIEKIKKEKKIPPFLSIRDFNRENLFMDLTGAIGKFSNRLYTHSEIYKLLLATFPLEQKEATESNRIKISYDSRGFAEYVSITKKSVPAADNLSVALHKLFNYY